MYHTLFLGVMCIYFHLYTRKCQNSELVSHSTVRNPYTKSLSDKNSFIPIKYKYLPSFWDQVEVDTTIFRILGNKWKKLFFPDGRARPGENLWFEVFFFVIIFTPFSVERYIKFYIWKCSQFDVEYNKNNSIMYLFLLPMQVDIKKVMIENSYVRSNITQPNGQ